MIDSYTPEEVAFFHKRYIPADLRTWPYFPIIMPSRNGKGPSTAKECDEIAFEVWDRSCNSIDSFAYLYEAVERAMILNLELFKKAGQ